jgi:hypothetical protein
LNKLWVNSDELRYYVIVGLTKCLNSVDRRRDIHCNRTNMHLHGSDAR